MVSFPKSGHIWCAIKGGDGLQTTIAQSQSNNCTKSKQHWHNEHKQYHLLKWTNNRQKQMLIDYLHAV